MAIATKKAQFSGLATKLIDAEILSEEIATAAFENAQKNNIAYVRYLIENKLVASAKLAHIISHQFGIPLLNLESIIIDPELKGIVKPSLIEKHFALPIYKHGKTIFIAIADPTNLHGLDEIKFSLGEGLIEPILVAWDKLSNMIDASINHNESAFDELDGEDLDDFDDVDVAHEEEQNDESDIDDAPVVKFVTKCLLDAIRKGASDLHFEPYEKSYRVRFRIDGMLEEVTKPPVALAGKIASRIKVMSRLDVSERRVPQDGRIKLRLSKTKSIDLRVSTCPTMYGEKACLRILDSDAAKLNIDQLGYEDFQKDLFLENIQKPYGMFLVTGPTGSGKTVSLYTGINILNKNEVNISTAEDPVEINLQGVNQVQVDERTGMTFPKALRAFLRQDPDIILVGEIRDFETGSIAVKAAQTGHMVMSTLHTNDGPQTLTRLQDMGIQPFAVATTINLITAQRLCRRLHPEYRSSHEVPNEVLIDEGFPEDWITKDLRIYKAKEGNPECPSGYKGRAGIYQVMPISDSIRRLIIEGANAVQLADQAHKDGVWDLRKSGLFKVKNGITSLAEINRVTVE